MRVETAKDTLFELGDELVREVIEIPPDKVGPIVLEAIWIHRGVSATDAKEIAGVALAMILEAFEQFDRGFFVVFGGASNHDDLGSVILDGGEEGVVRDVGAHVDDVPTRQF